MAELLKDIVARWQVDQDSNVDDDYECVCGEYDCGDCHSGWCDCGDCLVCQCLSHHRSVPVYYGDCDCMHDYDESCEEF